MADPTRAAAGTATRRQPMLETVPCLTLLAPRSRFSLRGEPAARLATGAVLGFALPEAACRSSAAGERAALWLGPDEQLLFAPAADGATLFAALEATLAAIPHSLVDISHRQVALEITSPHAADILNGCSPLDLSIESFPVGMCTRTVFDKADIVLWRTAKDAFQIEVWRSFSSYVAGLIGEIAREYPPR